MNFFALFILFCCLLY
ncbi:MAG: hypothetical protein LBU36_08885 [Clostridiales bacterium]|nr:hypothetical protein [Clostridiales bacterium]MDR3092282.1 hypothetical protein [Clostridiales bacterium]